jgi:hypothetical protein
MSSFILTVIAALTASGFVLGYRRESKPSLRRGERMSFYTYRPAVLPLRDSGAFVFVLGL